jgi:hypothetical protein
MDARSTEVHRESFMTGDGYVIVWPHPETLEPTIWPQYAEQMAIEYDTTTPGVVARAAKLWRDKTAWRLNIYLPDRIEKFEHATNDEGVFAKIRDVLARGLDPMKRWQALASDLSPDGVIENPYGRVPVFHFPNKRMFAPGISELEDVIPLQDALNKTTCDQLVAQEFTAFRQRWVTGIDVDVDEETGQVKAPPFKAGADKIFAATDPTPKFGEFGATDLTQFLEVEENLRAEIARVSGVPLHYLFITRGDFPSGEAMKSAEARFTKKTVDKQDAFGDVWEDALTFALRIDATEIPDDFTLASVWENAAPQSEEEVARTLLLKRRLGVTRRQLLKEAGYSDELIGQMLTEEPGAFQDGLGPEPPAPARLSAIPSSAELIPAESALCRCATTETTRRSPR